MQNSAETEPNPPDSEEGRASLTLVIMRLFVCGFAFIVAAVAASLVGTFALYRGLEGDDVYVAAFWGTAIVAILAVAYSALVPFGVIIVVSEVMRLRSVLVFMIGSAVIAVGYALSILGTDISFADRRLVIAAAAGVVGGFVYWLLAGRRAGAFRERLYRPSTQHSQ